MPRRKSSAVKVKSKTEIISTYTFNDLPDEILLPILSYLSFSELLPLTVTSKRLKTLSEDETLWEIFIRQYFSYAQARLLEQPNRRQAFIAQFNNAFDRRFFPDLQDKKQIFSALEGNILDIFDSGEDSDTTAALLATAIANRPLPLPFQKEGRSLTLNLSDVGLALICAARNQNEEQVNNLFRVLKKHSMKKEMKNSYALLQPIIRKALIRSGNIPATLHIFKKAAILTQYEMIEHSLEYDNINPLVKALLKHCYSCEPELTSHKFLSKEAARQKKYIEVFTIRNPENKKAQAAAIGHVIPLPSKHSSSRKKITARAERKALQSATNREREEIGKIAIKQGYIDLFKKLLTLGYKSNGDFFLLGSPGPAGNRAKRLLQAAADKACILAVKRNDEKSLIHILNHHNISPLNRGKSFIYAATSSYLKLLPILLGEDGHGVEKSYVDDVLESADEEVINYLSEHYRFLLPFELLHKTQGFLGAIFSKVSDHFSHPSPHSKEDPDTTSSSQIQTLESIFDTVMNYEEPKREDFSNPTQLVLAFQQFAQEQKLSPSTLCTLSRSKAKSSRSKRKRM